MVIFVIPELPFSSGVDFTSGMGLFCRWASGRFTGGGKGTRVLGLGSAAEAIEGLDDDEKGVTESDTLREGQAMATILDVWGEVGEIFQT